jgi:subtilisin family serine protease
VIFERGPGREQVTFIERKVRGHLQVIPVDAVPYLQAGRLDPRLFDVTTLLEFGYDQRRADLPLIVTGPATPRGARVLRALSGLDARVATVERDSIGTLWRSFTTGQPDAGGPTIWLDGIRELALDVSVPQIGAPTAWQAGYDGTGVRVAVVDSGIDATHPDLAGKVAAQRNFVADEEDELDRAGHGTHVAGTIAGTGAASGGRYTGVAPGADPLEQAVADLTEQYGALFVIAAGNSGPRDQLASFSSRGPRVGDAALKPDITAPGVAIASARSSHNSQGEPGDQYIGNSGASMATPHVAGAAAIISQRQPDWRAAELKAALMASAQPDPATGIFGQGAGRVDVARAIGQTIAASPASVSFGVQRWPHDHDTPVTTTVSYRNHGDADVALALEVQAAGPDGIPAPPGMFTVDESVVTVPAGGTAEVTVTADTRVDGPDGFFGGHLVATAAGSVTRTALAVEREPESYEVTVTHSDRIGQPTGQYQTLIASHDNP